MPKIRSNRIILTQRDRENFQNTSVNLTADTLSSYLTQASQGIPMRLFKFADEIRWKDPDILHAVNTRSANITNLQWEISDPELDQTLRDIRGDSWQGLGDFSDVLESFMGTTLLTGVRIVELVYDEAGKVIGFNKIPPQFMTYWESYYTPKLWTETSGDEGIEFAQSKVLYHVHGTGEDASAGALIRCLGWLYLFKTDLYRSSLLFSEKYGNPLHIISVEGEGDGYDKDITNAKAILNQFKLNGAVFRDGVSVDVIENSIGGGEFFLETIDDIKKSIKKVILGQTSSADAEDSNRSTAEEHMKVLEKLRLSDVRLIEATINDQLLPMLALSLGKEVGDAKFEFLVEDTRNEEEETDDLEEGSDGV